MNLTPEQSQLANRMGKQTPRYQKLFRLLDQHYHCIDKDNTRWRDLTKQSIDAIMQTAPSGSGFDNGTHLIPRGALEDYPTKLKFQTSFHHMHESGMYDGWTEHIVIVKADMHFGFRLIIGGRNRNEIKDYIHEVFECWLSEKVFEYDSY